MERCSKKRRLRYGEERLEKADEGEWEKILGHYLPSDAQGVNSAHPEIKKLPGLGGGHAVKMSGSGSDIEDRKTGEDANEDEDKDRVEANEDDEDGEDGEDEDEDEDEDDEDEDDDEEEDEEDEEYDQSDSSSYISDPSNSGDEDAVAEAKMKSDEFETRKEMEVQEAYSVLEAALKTGKTVPIGPIDGGRWDLYSTQFLSDPFDAHSGKSLSFGCFYDDLEDIPGAACEPGQLSAELHIYPEGHLDFFPFDPPAHATLEPVILKSWQNHDVELIFLGDGYLKLRIDLDVIMGKSTPHHIGEQPKMIEFSGIWTSDEEWRRRRLESIRPPSPKDSIAASLLGYNY